MPGINRLQEGLQDVDFKTLNNRIDSAEYKMVIWLIDQRIAECSAHQL